MFRLVSKLSTMCALTLMAAPAFAGPPPAPAAPAPAPAAPAPAPVVVSDQFILDCQVNGRTQRFSIVNGVLAEGSGTVTQLAEDAYSVTTAEGNLLLTHDSVQISGGRDAGKWDCVRLPVQGGTAVASTPAIDPAEFAALQQSVEGLRDGLARSEGDVARLQGQLNDTLASAAATQAAQANAEAGLARSEASLATAMADNARLEAEIGMATSAFAASDVELATAQETIGALEGALGAAQTDIAVLEDDLATSQAANGALEAELAAAYAAAAEMSDDDSMSEETSPDAATDADSMAEVEVVENQPTMMADGFDADIAMEMLEGADLSPISHAALTTAIDQARTNPDMVAEVMSRLQAVLGQ